MTTRSRLVYRLRNTPVRRLLRALERDGFLRIRSRRTGGYFYKHPDGRQTVIHYHLGSDILARKTLAEVISATEWTEEDLQWLGLI